MAILDNIMKQRPRLDKHYKATRNLERDPGFFFPFPISPRRATLLSCLLSLDRPSSRSPFSFLVRSGRSVELAQDGVIEVLLDALSDILRSIVIDREDADRRLTSVGDDIGLAGKAAITSDAGIDTGRVGEV